MLWKDNTLACSENNFLISYTHENINSYKKKSLYRVRFQPVHFVIYCIF